MTPTQIRIATTDLSSGFGPQQLASLKGMFLAVIEMVEEGDFVEEENLPEPQASYQSIGKLFVKLAKEVSIDAKGLN